MQARATESASWVWTGDWAKARWCGGGGVDDVGYFMKMISMKQIVLV